MRKKLFSLGFVYFSFRLTSIAQEPIIANELILKVPPLSEWATIRIGKQLACIEGLHFSGYDKQGNYLFLKYDAFKIPDPAIINIIIHHLNNKMKVETLKGYTIYEVIDGATK